MAHAPRINQNVNVIRWRFQPGPQVEPLGVLADQRPKSMPNRSEHLEILSGYLT